MFNTRTAVDRPEPFGSPNMDGEHELDPACVRHFQALIGTGRRRRLPALRGMQLEHVAEPARSRVSTTDSHVAVERGFVFESVPVDPTEPPQRRRFDSLFAVAFSRCPKEDSLRFDPKLSVTFEDGVAMLGRVDCGSHRPSADRSFGVGVGPNAEEWIADAVCVRHDARSTYYLMLVGVCARKSRSALCQNCVTSPRNPGATPSFTGKR
jgi:hypothetical protein